MDLKVPCIYRIRCPCSKVCVGQSGRTSDARYTERKKDIRVDQPEKSAVAEHSNTTAHRMNFSGALWSIRILGPSCRRSTCIRLNTNGFNGQRLHIKPGLAACIQRVNKSRSTAKQSQYFTPPTNTHCLGTDCEQRLRGGVYCIQRGLTPTLFSSLTTGMNMVLRTLVYRFHTPDAAASTRKFYRIRK